MSKLRKIIAVLVITIFMIGFLGSLNVVKAADQKNLGIIAYRRGGEDFWANNKDGTHIFKIVEFTGTDSTSTAILNNDVYYCLKFGQGFGGTNPLPKVYNDVGNLKDKTTIASTYANQLEWLNTNRYSSVMWLVDNMYIGVSAVNTSNQTEREAYLNNVRGELQRIVSQRFANMPLELDVFEQLVINSNGVYWTNTCNQLVALSNDEIDAVQQMALWYFTNGYTGDITNFTALAETDYVKNSFYKYKASAPNSEITEHSDGMVALFGYYLINGIKAAQNSYVPTSDNEHVLTLTSPSELATLTENSGTYTYLAGPFKFTGSDLPSSLQITGTVKINGNTAAVGTNGVTAFKLGTKNGNGVTEKTLNEILDTDSKEFYIWVTATNELDTIGIDVTTTISTRSARYYSVNASEVNANQPVIKIDGSPKSDNLHGEIGVQKSNKAFDLALRKYITAIDGQAVTNRVPDPDTRQLKAGTQTTADYYHRKNPLEVEIGQTVQYTIRVYNEGEVDGYVNEITDYLPPNLEFKVNDSTNLANGWVIDQGNSKIVRTTKYAKNGTSPRLLRKFETDLDYLDVTIVCTVVSTNPMPEKITNIAEITAFSDSNGAAVTDRDSQASNVNTAPEFPSSQTDSKWSTYKDSEIAAKEQIGTRYYIPGNQDDDDFEKVRIKELDLALRKNIASIDGVEPTNRKPVPITTRLNNPDTTAVYNHRKNPLTVNEGSVVIYTITVYNEGAVDGYAGEITDHLPPNLQFIEGHEINTQYGWTYDSTSHVAKTTYLSHAKNATNNLLVAFTTTQSLADPAKNGFKTVQIACRVIVTDPMPAEITNIAEISKYENKNGTELAKDRDSTSKNVNTASQFPQSQTDSKWSTYFDDKIAAQTQNTYYIPGNEDDDDFEKVKLRQLEFDLALRKFITNINGTAITTRIPQVDTTPLKNGETTAIYKHEKQPLRVNIGDTVEYTIRVYNEGEVDGYAEQVTDFLPEQLEFIAASNPGWTYDASTRKITTDLLSKAKSADNLITHFNGGDTLDYKDLKVVCKVVNTTPMPNVITNIAAVTDDADQNGNEVTDRDSSPENSPNVPSSELPGYKGNESNKDDLTDSNYYYKGQQDDDDFEKLTLRQFDLALRKYITSINGVSPETSREPVVNTANLRNGGTTATYTHPKTPLKVAVGDRVIYTLRVYNEGDVDGYANEITDYVPEQLEYVTNSEVNTQYEWTYDSANRKATTHYLSYEKDRNGNLINAYDGGNSLSYKEVKIEFKVVNTANMPSKITNIAEITEDKNSNGEDVDDRDSTPDNLVKPTDWPGYKDDEINKPYVPGQEDDDDFEKVILREFDLALRKFITKVGDKEITDRVPQVDTTPLKNGGTTATYNHPKTPLKVAIGDKIVYTLRVYNEGDVDGYANEITDYVPEQLEYVTNSEINTQYGWTYDSTTRKVTTDYLSYEENREGNLIKAFDGGNSLSYKDVKIEFKVKKTDNMPSKITNIAEITEDKNSNGEDVDDRDSTPDDLVKPTDWPGYKDDEINKPYVPGQEDDDDFEKVMLKEFDLALRKFISQVGETEITSRIPQVDTTPLKNGETTATYTHPKTPLEVSIGSTIVYTLRVYNEGEVDGYANEITDYVPAQLEYVEDSDINEQYGWTYDKNTRKVSTDYLSYEKNREGNVIKAFDGGNTLSYKDVKIEFKLVSTENMPKKITNIAEITKDKDKEGNEVEDRDSTPDDLVKPEDWPGYKDDEIDKPYVPGQEDDDDFEKVIIKEFDLALRKFITKVGDTEITNRIPQVDVTPLKEGKTTATYTHPKDALLVANGVIVEYTIRVYNEGEIDGYATEITDDIPKGLEFLPDHETNKKYGWSKVEGKEEIRTRYLENELIKAFDGEKLDYKDVVIAFKVIEPTTSDRIITNYAQISEDKDKDGKDVEDRDSTPDEWKGEDDEDIENIKVTYFDLALRKWVTQAIVTDENGKTTVTETGHKAEDDPEQVVKVDLKNSKINKVTVKFRYSIRVTNEGKIAGYVKEIKDYIPEGLKFIQEDNPNWKVLEGNQVVTEECKDVLLKPGESTEVTIILTWINGANNMGLKDNWAEISKDYNDYDAPDIDSVPNNDKKGEDDIDDAPVILQVQTGEAVRYIAITAGCLMILSAGIVLIKKFVL